MSNISLKAKVIEISDERIVNTRFGEKRVANALIEDETGRISLTLWEEQIGLVSKGDVVLIENAYCTQWRGEKQLNIPRRGKIKIE